MTNFSDASGVAIASCTVPLWVHLFSYAVCNAYFLKYAEDIYALIYW